MIYLIALLWRWHWATTIPEIEIPAAPVPPSPNAYDFYVKASQAIYPSKPAPGARQSEDLVPREMRIAATPLARKEAWLARNAKALVILRQGFQYACRVPANRQGHITDRLNERLRIRALAEVVQVEARLVRRRGQGLQAAHCALDILKLGHDLALGGTSRDQAFSVALNAMGRYELWLTLPHLNQAELAIVMQRFDQIMQRRVSFSEIIHENNFFTLAMIKNSLEQQRTFDREISWHLPQQVYHRLKTPLRRDLENTMRLNTVFQQFATQPYPSKLDISQLPSDGLSRMIIKSYERHRLTYAREETGSALIKVALALENYRLKQHNYPTALKQLIPQELPQIPHDPFRPGKHLRYKRIGTKYVLYSVGPDGRDDGGKVIDNQKLNDPLLTKYGVVNKSKGDFVAGINY